MSPSANIGCISKPRFARFTAHRRHFSSVSEKRLFIRGESAHGFDMTIRARLHSVEIIFYSAASFLVMAGMTWLFLR
jgi:hypothetical protein